MYCTSLHSNILTTSDVTPLLLPLPRAVVLVPGCIHVSCGQDRGPCVETVPRLPGPVEQVFWVSGKVTSCRWTWCCQGTCTTLPVICRLLLIPIALSPDAPPHPSTTQPHYTLHTPTLNPHILPLTGAEQYYCHYHNQQWSNCHDSDSIMIVTCLVKASYFFTFTICCRAWNCALGLFSRWKCRCVVSVPVSCKRPSTHTTRYHHTLQICTCYCLHLLSLTKSVLRLLLLW